MFRTLSCWMLTLQSDVWDGSWANGKGSQCRPGSRRASQAGLSTQVGQRQDPEAGAQVGIGRLSSGTREEVL